MPGRDPGMFPGTTIGGRFHRMLDRFRNRGGAGAGPGRRPGPMTPQRHVTRRDREHRQRQLLILFTGAAAVVVVLALAIGAFYQYFWFPRQTIASVNGTEIRRVDYIKARKYLVLQENARLNQQIQTAGEDQIPQMQARLAQLQEEFNDLRDGDINPDAQTVSDMVDDQIVLDNIDGLGITITDDDVDQYVLEIFSPVPLGEATPTPTVEPTAAAWATETMEAFEVQITETAEAAETEAAQPTEVSEGTPDLDATQDPDAASEDESTPEVPDPETTPTVQVEVITPSPDEESTQDVEVSPTVEPTETPNAEQAVETAEASYDLLETNFLEPADMSRGDFERLIVRPALARQRAQEQLAADVSPRADQAHIAHILVATEDAARELIDTRLQEEEFEDVAREVSIDEQSAQDGGDLGWAPQGVYVEEFGDAAFALEPGEISEPVQTEFGWHIIRVIEREDDRPLSIQALDQVKQAAFQRWLGDLREQADIDTDVTLPSEQPQLPPTG